MLSAIFTNKSRLSGLAVALILLWQAAVCGIEAAVIPMHGHEAPYALHTSWFFEANGWLYYIIARFFRIFGAELLFLRLVSCAAYLGASVLVYLTAKSISGSRAGVFSLLFYALSGMSLSYAHFCRFYSFGVLLALLSVFMLIKTLGPDGSKYLYYYLLACILAPAAMMLNIVIIAGEWVYVLSCVRKKALRNALLLSQALSGAAFFILWAFDATGLSRVADGTMPVDLILQNIPVLLSVKPGTELFSVFSSSYAVIIAIAAAAAAILFFVSKSRRRDGALLVSAVFLLSSLVFIAFSANIKNICTLKNEVIFIPFGAIILGSAVSFMKKGISIGLLMILGLIAGSLGYNNAEDLAPRAALEQMRAFPKRGAVIWDKSLFADSYEFVEEISDLDIEKVIIKHDILLPHVISSIPCGYFWIAGPYYPDKLEDLLKYSQQELKIYCISHLNNKPIYFVRKMK